ncbi:hypothetical protein PR001_g4566 [Phytophthora rubi]|uniref:Uncharacterized protein n=1 Tax=Phytophthora rubi TaxID=129364 RepID=A0A6A3NFM8_9STRA|nr:hypothetical protein PR002_g4730 [Phytophthora rubi]KAE9046459.1 hypothetical protein PR001_g4566 [Phytophthora rubi]
MTRQITSTKPAVLGKTKKTDPKQERRRECEPAHRTWWRRPSRGGGLVENVAVIRAALRERKPVAYVGAAEGFVNDNDGDKDYDPMEDPDDEKSASGKSATDGVVGSATMAKSMLEEAVGSATLAKSVPEEAGGAIGSNAADRRHQEDIGISADNQGSRSTLFDKLISTWLYGVKKSQANTNQYCQHL